MGLLSNKDNEANAGKVLQEMMNKFEIDLDEKIDDVDKDGEKDRNKRRKEKIEKEKLDF